MVDDTQVTDAGGDKGNAFAAEFARWRDVRGLSRAALARKMDYDRSYVSKVESGAEHPSREFALQAETVLAAGGALREAFRAFETGREPRVRPSAAAEPKEPTGVQALDATRAVQSTRLLDHLTPLEDEAGRHAGDIDVQPLHHEIRLLRSAA